MSQFILPGDNLEPLLSSDSGKPPTIGPGVYRAPLSQPIPVRAGFLVNQIKPSSSVVYVESNSRRYIPSVKDHVVGIVSGKQSEGFRVLLQDNSPTVRLGQFAFENASKKNKPILPVGTLVYGRISMADRDIEAEMECVDPSTGKASGFGELKGGFVVEVSLAYARSLLFHGGPVLSSIGEIVPFEIAIGMNGKIWIDGPDNDTILKIAQCITKSESLPADKVADMVSRTLSGKKVK